MSERDISAAQNSAIDEALAELGGSDEAPNLGHAVDPPILEPFSIAPSLSHVPAMTQLASINRAKDITAGKTYGAPRVFDVYTLFAVTLAFGLLVAGMQLLRPLFPEATTEVTVWVSFFVTAVAIGQAVLFGGRHPRLASILAGPFVLFVCYIIAYWRSGNSLSPFGLIQELLATFVSTGFLGVAAGYLAGTIVAGVFMIAENFRRLPILKWLGVKSTSSDHDLSIDEID